MDVECDESWTLSVVIVWTWSVESECSFAFSVHFRVDLGFGSLASLDCWRFRSPTGAAPLVYSFIFVWCFVLLFLLVCIF